MKYLVIAALLVIAGLFVSTIAKAAPVQDKAAVAAAVKRDQLIKDLSKAPASVFNICARC